MLLQPYQLLAIFLTWSSDSALCSALVQCTSKTKRIKKVGQEIRTWKDSEFWYLGNIRGLHWKWDFWLSDAFISLIYASQHTVLWKLTLVALFDNLTDCIVEIYIMVHITHTWIHDYKSKHVAVSCPMMSPRFHPSCTWEMLDGDTKTPLHIIWVLFVTERREFLCDKHPGKIVFLPAKRETILIDPPQENWMRD